MEIRKKTSSVSLLNGYVYDNISDRIIDHPALVIDTETGTLHAWGESDKVEKRFNEMSAALAGTPMENDLFMLKMDTTALSPAEQCYILKRCIEYTASNFQKELCNKVRQGCALEWIKEEMQLRPLDLE